MIYLFEDVKTGEQVSIDVPVERAPPLGSIIRRKGRRFRRLVTMPQAPQVSSNVYRCYQVPRSGEAAKGADFYENGVPCFRSKKSLDEWANKKTGDEVFPITTDF